ncbi:hypothetical protein BC828DRAFT_387204 [Blastocladiella britannica]|nr:hypothetical protein BC828DRAFT_387204 [Blastocladiella britannica]
MISTATNGRSMASAHGTAASTMASSGAGSLKALPIVLFDIAKRESHSPASNLKLLTRKLKSTFKVLLNKDEITLNRIFEASVVIFWGPREKFSSGEFSALKSYLDIGGSIMYLAGEGGEAASGCNFNYLLEELGISINADVVIQSAHTKYHHPKEALVSQGVLNRELTRLARTLGGPEASFAPPPIKGVLQTSTDGLPFLLPYGATLNVQKPSIPILGSGPMSYPVSRPVAAVYAHPNGKGKLAAIASTEIFSDAYMEKEGNASIFQVIMSWLTSDKVHWNAIDANEPEITDYHYLPSTLSLASQPRACLQDTEELPRDFSRLFDHSLFGLDLSLVPEALNAASKLRLKNEPLTLIAPQFEAPLPPLTPAVFPPMLRELAPPPLELFDLDAHLAPPLARLAQTSAKCNDDDLEYFLREAGSILSLAPYAPAAAATTSMSSIDGKSGGGEGEEEHKVQQPQARRVLDTLVRQVAAWKRTTAI